MQVIFKENAMPMVGGITPQVEGVKIVARTGDWIVAEVDDNQLSAIQEFNVQPIVDGFADAITGPQVEGSLGDGLKGIENFGNKMLPENNPGQDTNGHNIRPTDYKDDKSKKNFTSEDVAPFRAANAYVKKYDAKSVLRNQIRGNIVDIEDDIADTKIASQLALYYFAHEWQTRTQAQKDANPAKDNMEYLATKLLSDDVKMRADLAHGIDSINEIVEKEETINKFISENYTYNETRGASA